MTPVSSRYAAPLIVVLGVLLVPLAWVRLHPSRLDPCASPTALLATEQIAGSRPAGERREAMTDEVFQWSQGTVPHPLSEQGELEFQIIRSYDARPFYERPVWVMKGKFQPERHELREVEAPGGRTLPIHLVKDGTKQPNRIAGYLFAYGVDPVESPFLHQLGHALQELVMGRQPLTLIIVGGIAPKKQRAAVEQGVQEWLTAAWAHFEAACAVPKP